MAIVVTFYVKYTISTARAESNIRRAGELQQAKEARVQSHTTVTLKEEKQI